METRKHWPSTLLWLLGLGPLALAWYMAITGWGVPETTKNHGELVARGLTIPQEYRDLHRGRWGLVFISNQCDKHCKQQLLLMQQVHKSLGKEFSRLQSIWLKKNSHELFPPTKRTQKNHNANLLATWLKNNSLPVFDHSIWLVDPQGNLVLRFDEGTDGKDILTDIQWLLKVSRLG